MRQPPTLSSIAVMIGLLGVLTAGCSLERSVSATRAATGSGESGVVSEQQRRMLATEHAPDSHLSTAASTVVQVLPTDNFNAKISRAASNNASWTADPEQIVLRFWQEHVRDRYAEESPGSVPQISTLPISGQKVDYIEFRVTHDGDSNGDDTIARGWTDLRLHRDARSGLWQI